MEGLTKTCIGPMLAGKLTSYLRHCVTEKGRKPTQIIFSTQQQHFSLLLHISAISFSFYSCFHTDSALVSFHLAESCCKSLLWGRQSLCVGGWVCEAVHALMGA